MAQPVAESGVGRESPVPLADLAQIGEFGVPSRCASACQRCWWSEENVWSGLT